MSNDIKHNQKVYAERSRSGFTLIELLVVVAIIGMLAGLMIVNLSIVRQKSRDAKRRADLKTLQQAIEIFANEHGRYPVTAVGTWQYSTQTQPWIHDTSATPFNLAPDYISVLPLDPRNGQYFGSSSWGTSWRYFYRSDNGQEYKLMFANPESQEGITWAINDGGSTARDDCPAPSTATGIQCAYELFSAGAQGY